MINLCEKILDFNAANRVSLKNGWLYMTYDIRELDYIAIMFRKAKEKQKG